MKNNKEIKKGADNKYYLMYILKEMDNNTFSAMQHYGIAMFNQLVLKEAIKILKKEEVYKEIVISKKFLFAYIDSRKKLMKEQEIRLLTPYKEITSEEFYKIKDITDELQNCRLNISKESLSSEQVFYIQFKGESSCLYKEIFSPYIQI